MNPPVLASPNPNLPMYHAPSLRPCCKVCGRGTPSVLCFTCGEWANRLLRGSK